MGLKKKLARTITFSIADAVSSRLFSTASFVIAANFLVREDIGLIGVAAGILSLFGFLALSPETIIFRDYRKIKKTGTANEHISAFMIFWGIRTLALTGLSLAIAYFLFSQNSDAYLYLVLSVLAYNLGLLAGIFKEMLYVDFRQDVVTKFNFLLNIVFLAFVGVLFFNPTIIFYGIALAGSAVINVVVWMWIFVRHFGFRLSIPYKCFKMIRDNITEFSIWSHMISACASITYRIDALILSFFASLSVTGNYTIALTVANLLFVMPMMIQKSVSLALQNIEDKKSAKNSMNIFLRTSLILAVVQFACLLLFGRLVISVFTREGIEGIYTLAVIIGAGATLLNVFRPLISLAVYKTNIKKAFCFIFLPGIVFSIVSYVLLGYFYGATGIAFANVLSYFFTAVLLILYIRKEFPMNLNIRLFFTAGVKTDGK